MRTALIVIFFILFLGMAWVLTYGLMGGFDKEPTPTPTLTPIPTATAIPTPTPTVMPTIPPEIPNIIIKYSDTITSQIGWCTADLGYVFLVLDLDIENQGYESIGVGGAYFAVVVNNVKYGSTYTCLEDRIKYVYLLDGGRITGEIGFEVPQEVINIGYQPRYESWQEYNIEWIKQ